MAAVKNIIVDLWVLKECGTVIFESVEDKKIDPQLFGGFMSAIHSFASQINKQGMTNFQLGSKNFILKVQNGMIFIGTARIDTKLNLASKELDHIAEKFFELYPLEVLQSWNGNLAIFNDFQNKIYDDFDAKCIMKKMAALW